MFKDQIQCRHSINYSLHHVKLTVGRGFPLRQHSSLQVCRTCITRGRNRNVKTGADSFSSCHKLYPSGSRRRTGCTSGLYCGTAFGTAANAIQRSQLLTRHQISCHITVTEKVREIPFLLTITKNSTVLCILHKHFL
jgi:hypothetical protein